MRHLEAGNFYVYCGTVYDLSGVPLKSGELRSNLIGFLSSRIGVVSSDVILPLSSLLIVGLSAKLNELHSSEVGETSGVNVVGVTDPGLKN